MLVLLLAALSLVCLYLGVTFLRRALALTATATSYIRSAAQGYVVLEGEGSPPPGHVIRGPFSGKPCLWWSTQVVSMLAPMPSGGGPAPNPGAFDRRSSTDPFLLKDGTGECFVDPTEAEVRASTKQTWYGSSMEVHSLSQAHLSPALEDDFRFVEERIELHQRIVARGYFRTQVNKNTQTNTLSQPPDGRHFVLSTVREDVMARRLRIRAALTLGLCVLLAACAVYAASP